jgi:carboxymethylenebutenolidase
MIEKPVHIHAADGMADGLLIQPKKEGRWPGIIHLTDIGGIRQASTDMARRQTSEGYVVLLPNVFYRSGKPPMFHGPVNFGTEEFMKRVNELRQALPPDAQDRDIPAYVDFLAKQPAVKDGRFGVVGYCFTGAMAMRTAAERPDRIAAAASFHGGGLYADVPTSPHLLLSRIKARLYFGHGTDDRSMPTEAIEKFDRTLAAWGGQYESEIYPAHHGWTVRDNPTYDELQAERAFHKLAELLAAALKHQ